MQAERPPGRSAAAPPAVRRVRVPVEAREVAVHFHGAARRAGKRFRHPRRGVVLLDREADQPQHRARPRRARLRRPPAGAVRRRRRARRAGGPRALPSRAGPGGDVEEHRRAVGEPHRDAVRLERRVGVPVRGVVHEVDAQRAHLDQRARQPHVAARGGTPPCARGPPPGAARSARAPSARSPRARPRRSSQAAASQTPAPRIAVPFICGR